MISFGAITALIGLPFAVIAGYWLSSGKYAAGIITVIAAIAATIGIGYLEFQSRQSQLTDSTRRSEGLAEALGESKLREQELLLDLRMLRVEQRTASNSVAKQLSDAKAAAEASKSRSMLLSEEIRSVTSSNAKLREDLVQAEDDRRAILGRLAQAKIEADGSKTRELEAAQALLLVRAENRKLILEIGALGRQSEAVNEAIASQNRLKRQELIDRNRSEYCATTYTRTGNSVSWIPESQFDLNIIGGGTCHCGKYVADRNSLRPLSC